jgi:hypothetical protein
VQIVGVLSQVYRFWRVSTLVERQQTKWMVFGLVTLVLTLLIYSRFDLPELSAKLSEITVVSLVFLLIPVTLSISILRYRLWDIDLVIHHTLLYSALTATVAGGYIFIVTVLSVIMSTESSFIASILATGIIAALFAPLRAWIQSGVNRLIYGERDAPYVVLSRLGRLLAGTASPATTLHTLVETVATALKFPYVAIELKNDSDESPAGSGTPPAVDEEHRTDSWNRLTSKPSRPPLALSSSCVPPSARPWSASLRSSIRC